MTQDLPICITVHFKSHWLCITSIISEITGPEVIKLFSCPTQLGTKFQLLIKTKIATNKEVSCFSLSDVVFIMLMNTKMPTIEQDNFFQLSMKKFYNLRARFAFSIWKIMNILYSSRINVIENWNLDLQLILDNIKKSLGLLQETKIAIILFHPLVHLKFLIPILILHRAS